MEFSLEPKVLKRQENKELIFPAPQDNIELMVPGDAGCMVSPIDERKEFAERLNRVLDEEGFPRKGKGRQVELGKRFGVSQKAAAKWLEGEAMPELKRIPEIARDLDICSEWLLTGRGPMRPEVPLSKEAAEFARDWEGLPPRERAAMRAAVRALKKPDTDPVETG